MILEIYLDASELNHRQILVINDELMQKVRVDIGNGSLSTHLKYIDKISKKQTILLESWQLFLMEPVNSSVVDLPIVYKKSIVFFRSLYTYVRQLPAYRLFRRLRKMKLNGLKLGYRLTTAPMTPDNEIGIDTPISETDSHGSASNHAFDPIDTPLGSFVLNVRYRSNCNFCVEDPEAVLSSRFTTTDKENFLTSSPNEIESQYQDHSYGSRQHGSLESRSYRISRTSSLRSSHGSARIPSTDDYVSKPISSTTPRAGSSFSPKEYDVRRFSQPPNLRPSPTLSSAGSRHHVRTRSLSSTGGKNSMDIYENESRSEFDNRVGASGTNQIPSNSLRRPVWNQASSIYSRSPSSRPSLSIISPFKSPSLSSSPASVHENSASPSLGSLRKRNSSTSLHQQYAHSSFSRTGATPPPPLARTSTTTTKLASSFGNRFSSDFSREEVRASPGLPRRHRTASLLSNDGLYDNTGRTSRPQSRASILTNQPDEEDVGDFVKLIDDRSPLKMFNSSQSADKETVNSGIANLSQYTLSRFHQLKQENSLLSESILEASAVLSSTRETVQSEHSVCGAVSVIDNKPLETKEAPPTTSEDTLDQQATRTNIKSSGSLSMPNSFVAQRIRAFDRTDASVLKPSKSMDTMRRGYFDDESDSESDESEEGKPSYRIDVDNQAFFNNMDSFCW
ncbi:autophagy protein 13, variant 2 [Basidiobolus ranarum]